MTTTLKICLFAALTLALSSCDSARNNHPVKGIPVKESRDGLRYKLVTIEGRVFVATQGYNGYWQLSGPIDR